MPWHSPWPLPEGPTGRCPTMIRCKGCQTAAPSCTVGPATHTATMALCPALSCHPFFVQQHASSRGTLPIDCCSCWGFHTVREQGILCHCLHTRVRCVNRLANQRHHLHKTRCCLPLLVISHTNCRCTSHTRKPLCHTAASLSHCKVPHIHTHNRPHLLTAYIAVLRARLPALVLCDRPDQHKAAFTPPPANPSPPRPQAVTQPQPPLRASRMPSHQHHRRPS